MVDHDVWCDMGLCGAQKYTNMDRPRGSMQERVDIAVDALCTLCIGAHSLQHSTMEGQYTQIFRSWVLGTKEAVDIRFLKEKSGSGNSWHEYNTF